LKIIQVGNLPPHGFEVLRELMEEMDTYVREEVTKRE
jgi:hypothetical protein